MLKVIFSTYLVYTLTDPVCKIIELFLVPVCMVMDMFNLATLGLHTLNQKQKTYNNNNLVNTKHIASYIHINCISFQTVLMNQLKL